ncbi:MFS transporter [Nocardioides sp. NPDC023903]|uniref:MFS transporter n=1 Tax=Nocardioides sp. NPDC023903 TaxID=3157195 RepID=UPI0033CBA3F4
MTNQTNDKPGTPPIGGSPSNGNEVTSDVPMIRVAVASLMGTVIEFYDFLIFAAAAALVFGHVFFPALGEAAGTAAAFGTLGVAFIARPIGAVLFGHVGDRLGRKRTLIVTMLVMGFATVAIGLLPTPATIGAAAPILLVTLRLCQGLAAGGEWAGAVLFTSEHAPAGKRGFWSMFTNLGGAIASLLALGTFFIADLAMSDADFRSYGWRIPFLLSALLLLFGLWIRLKTNETPVFEQDRARREKTELPVIEAIRRQWREILLGGGALLMPFALYYMGASYLVNYGTSALDLGSSSVLGAAVVGGLTLAAGVVAGGALSDRIGRRRVILTASCVAVGWCLVLFPLLDTRSLLIFWVGLCISTLISGFAYGVAGSYLSELFETRYRYTAAAIAYSLGAIFGGALPPLVAAPVTSTEALGSYGMSLLLALLCLVSATCTFVVKDTSKRDLTNITAVVVAGSRP